MKNNSKFNKVIKIKIHQTKYNYWFINNNQCSIQEQKQIESQIFICLTNIISYKIRNYEK